ncbi:hypothetical protein GTP55_25445 [Duganella sp. FT109W]|uniref:Uncharacterized protein n=1 Tax=Duganella margarita TaxID=2692170 RepID=A0ABW9WR00_9BURK|nr:hypothetical protein [Duganella margarita]MYN42693.1 hypothetical protein [Duganella margarita]
MNAPISAALLQLRAGQVAAPVTQGDEPLRTVYVVQQPLVPTAARLLRAGYEHDGLRIDLYGTLDAAGYEVEHAALTGALDQIDIAVWLTREQLRQMSDWCDRHLPSAHELKLVSQQDARAERLQWQRNFAAEPP